MDQSLYFSLHEYTSVRNFWNTHKKKLEVFEGSFEKINQTLKKNWTEQTKSKLQHIFSLLYKQQHNQYSIVSCHKISLQQIPFYLNEIENIGMARHVKFPEFQRQNLRDRSKCIFSPNKFQSDQLNLSLFFHPKNIAKWNSGKKRRTMETLDGLDISPMWFVLCLMWRS